MRRSRLRGEGRAGDSILHEMVDGTCMWACPIGHVMDDVARPRGAVGGARPAHRRSCSSTATARRARQPSRTTTTTAPRRARQGRTAERRRPATGRRRRQHDGGARVQPPAGRSRARWRRCCTPTGQEAGQTLQAVKLDGAGNTYVAGNFTRELKVGGAMTTVMGDLPSAVRRQVRLRRRAAVALGGRAEGSRPAPRAGSDGRRRRGGVHRRLDRRDAGVPVGDDRGRPPEEPSSPASRWPPERCSPAASSPEGATAGACARARGRLDPRRGLLRRPRRAERRSASSTRSSTSNSDPWRRGASTAPARCRPRWARPEWRPRPAAVAVAADGDVILAGQITGPLDNGPAGGQRRRRRLSSRACNCRSPRGRCCSTVDGSPRSATPSAAIHASSRWRWRTTAT